MITAYLSDLFRWRTLPVLLGLIALGLLIWFLGPRVQFDGYAPLAGQTIRISVIASLFALAVLISLVRFIMARRANSKLINKLMESEELAGFAEDQSSEEVELIRERYDAALAQLKKMAMGRGANRRYLADLPWYIIVGPPGAGKTTLLRNSGLQFPMAEALGSDVIQGISGTRNCDWWFTDEAVLIDTAGRYTTQDVNRDIDRAAWTGFLDILKRGRPRRPINGVILAISAADLMLRTEAERKRGAETLKRRIQELVKTFEMRVPVYVMITKCDLISGFNEQFQDFDDQDREQVWGMTFSPDDDLKNPGPVFEERFRELVTRVRRITPERMRGERDVGRRGRVFMFPHALTSLTGVLSSFVTDVFRVSRFEQQAILRGVYFTSGTQEGTPIDRLLGAFSRVFGLQPGHQLAYSGKGKAFFITRLLSGVVFREQGMIGSNQRLERRLAVARAAAYGAVIAVVAGLSALWIGGLVQSTARASETSEAYQTLATTLDELRRQPEDLASTLPVLNAAFEVVHEAEEPSIGSWLEYFGISSRPQLSSAATGAYNRALVDLLLPRTVERIGQRVLVSARSDLDPADLRDTFEAYLMLGQPEFFDRSVIETAFAREVSVVFPLDPDQQQQMRGHYSRLASLLPRGVELDDRVIAAARGRIQSVPQVDQVYQALQREADRNASLRPFDVVGEIGTISLIISPERAVNGQIVQQIPGLYTRDGFYDFFLTRAPQLVREELGADWVSGEVQPESDAYRELAAALTDRYVQDYILYWQTMLDQIGVVAFSDIARAQSVLQSLASPDSPLTRLITRVRDNTTLPPPLDNQDTGPAPDQLAGGGTTNPVASAASAAAESAIRAALGNVDWPGDTIAQAFQPIHDLTDTTIGQSPLARVQQLMGTIFGTVSSVAAAPSPPSAAFDFISQRAQNPQGDALAELASDSALRPEPARNILRDVSANTWSLLVSLGFRHMNDVWRRDVLPICEEIVAGRFPMVQRSNTEVALQDFAELFRPQGLLDEFVSTTLGPFVSSRGGRLQAATVDGVTLPLSNDALSQFRQARVIQSAFFGAGASPEVSFSITPVYLDPRALRSTFSFDGEDIVYRHEPPRTFDLIWPNLADASVVSVAITTIDGDTLRWEETGSWALFRFLTNANVSRSGGSDSYQFTLQADGREDGSGGESVTYRLQAASVSNPFNPGLLAGFRCPGGL